MPDDAFAVIPYDTGSGVVADVPAASLVAFAPGLYVTPFQDFAFSWNGVTVQFQNGDPLAVEPAFKAALIAAGAPIT